MCVMQTPATWNMVSQTGHPCSASCNLITVASDEATFSAEETGPSRPMEEALTNLSFLDQTRGPSQSLAAICQTQHCPVLEEGERGEGWPWGLLLLQGQRTPESLPVSFLYFFLPRRSQKCLSDFHPPTSILFLCSRHCLAHWMCVSPDHCPKRGLDLFWSHPYWPAVCWPTKPDQMLHWDDPWGKG